MKCPKTFIERQLFFSTVKIIFSQYFLFKKKLNEKDNKQFQKCKNAHKSQQALT